VTDLVDVGDRSMDPAPTT